MALVTHLATGQQFHVADPSLYAGDSRYSVQPDGAASNGGGGSAVGYDPTVTQGQWLATYLHSIGQDQAANALQGEQNATSRYGADTTRLGVVGNLYSDLFGKPENLAATANLLRGQPNAGGLSFYRSLANLSPLGEGNDYGSMNTVDPNSVIKDLLGGVSGHGSTSTERHHGSASDGRPSNVVANPPQTTNPNYGIAPQELGVAGMSGISNPVPIRGRPLPGEAAGGSTIVDHPSYMMLDGRRIALGEYGRPERVTVTPLSDTPLPPRYYAGLMHGMAGGGMADVPDMGSVPNAGGAGMGGLDVTNPTPDPQTLAEITAVLHTPAALHPSPTEQAIRANWTLDSRGHPQFIGQPQQPMTGAPDPNAPPPGMAQGGAAVIYPNGNPAQLYGQGTTVGSAVGAPNSAGQVTVPSHAHAGHTDTVPYYEAQPFADPRTAQTGVVENLSPMELSLLGSTSAAQTGLPLSEWLSLFQRSRPSFQQVSTSANYRTAA